MSLCLCNIGDRSWFDGSFVSPDASPTELHTLSYSATCVFEVRNTCVSG